MYAHRTTTVATLILEAPVRAVRLGMLSQAQAGPCRHGIECRASRQALSPKRVTRRSRCGGISLARPRQFVQVLHLCLVAASGPEFRRFGSMRQSNIGTCAIPCVEDVGSCAASPDRGSAFGRFGSFSRDRLCSWATPWVRSNRFRTRVGYSVANTRVRVKSCHFGARPKGQFDHGDPGATQRLQLSKHAHFRVRNRCSIPH